MKKTHLYIVIGVLIFIIICLLSYKTSSTIIYKKDQNKITHDFGILNKKIRNKFSYNFKYVNTIYDTLKIYKVKDGCDCTSSFVKSGDYFKNDTIIISTTYNPLKYNDIGKIEKYIYLYTNKSLTTYDTILPFRLKGIVEE